MPDAETPEKLKRERAGTYISADGRFTVEQTSSGWLLLDAEQTNELGLPLTRGPFGTLDDARAAIAAARSGPAPKAEVVDIAARRSKGGAGASGRGLRTGTGTRRAGRDAPDDGAEADASEGEEPRTAGREQKPASKPKPRARRPEKPLVLVRELRAVDGDQLRKLWAACGFRSLGDDDLSLARLARRNPGLLLVASEGTQIVGSALGAWDGRRGWIYHLAIAETHRRQGIATRLVDQVEAGLRDLGCPKVSVLVRDENDDAREFWAARGYDRGSRQFARELRED